MSLLQKISKCLCRMWTDRGILPEKRGKGSGIKGIALIEAMAAVMIAGVMVVGVTMLNQRSNEDLRAQVAAEHMAAVGQAANVFMRENFAIVAGNATATQAHLILIDDLTASGHLPQGFSRVNAYGQSVCVIVIEPTATPNRLHAMVVAQGGSSINDATLGLVAASIGQGGGGLYASDPANMRGAMGAWSVPLATFNVSNHRNLRCDGASGVARPDVGRPVKATWFADESANAGLFRDAMPGNPGLNTMHTPLLLSASTTVRLHGTSCSPNGAMGRTALGELVMCESGVWRIQCEVVEGPCGGFNRAVQGQVCRSGSLPNEWVRGGVWASCTPPLPPPPPPPPCTIVNSACGGWGSAPWGGSCWSGAAAGWRVSGGAWVA